MKSFILESVTNFATDYDKELLTDSELIAKYSKYIEPKDLRHLDFSLSMNGSGSAGSFYKAVYLIPFTTASESYQLSCANVLILTLNN